MIEWPIPRASIDIRQRDSADLRACDGGTAPAGRRTIGDSRATFERPGRFRAGYLRELKRYLERDETLHAFLTR